MLACQFGSVLFHFISFLCRGDGIGSEGPMREDGSGAPLWWVLIPREIFGTQKKKKKKKIIRTVFPDPWQLDDPVRPVDIIYVRIRRCHLLRLREEMRRRDVVVSAVCGVGDLREGSRAIG